MYILEFLLGISEVLQVELGAFFEVEGSALFGISMLIAACAEKSCGHLRCSDVEFYVCVRKNGDSRYHVGRRDWEE